MRDISQMMMTTGILMLCLVAKVTEGTTHQQWRPRSSSSSSWASHRVRSQLPNIVFILTDDQDVELGSMNFMPKTQRILADGGATFQNAFVSTPMCCPSRSSILTGRYVHNHNVYTNNDNCTSIQWRNTFEKHNFGTYLTNAGYRTGYFGKYLNEYDGDYIPPGWTEWVGLIRNTRFYNYKINFNGRHVKHEDNYYEDYLTDLIANDSVTFLKQSKQYFPNRPVAMVLSMPAPHGPEDAAPQYQHLFKNITTHRTPSYDFAPNPDKQWLLQYNGKMEPIHHAFTNMLHTKRLQTLQSVDDAVEKLFVELESLGELDNTYIVYTSDHGYHLGQFGLIKGKAMPYEFDIRVPFYMRGPNIPKGVKVSNIALNIDLAPTFLDMAGIPTPEEMDGRSLLRLFDGASATDENHTLKRKKAWRDSFLVERGKITKKKILDRERLEAQKSRILAAKLLTKEQRLEQECNKAEYQPPCSPTQEWECGNDSSGKLRMYKCRGPNTRKLTSQMLGDAPQRDAPQPPMRMCPCSSHRDVQRDQQRQDYQLLHKQQKEKKRIRTFLRNNVNQPELLRNNYMKNYKALSRRYKRSLIGEDFIGPLNSPPTSDGPVECQVLSNGTVACIPVVPDEDDAVDDYDDDDDDDDDDVWKKQKDRLDEIIQTYKERLEELKDMRRYLKKERALFNSSSKSVTPVPYPSWLNPEHKEATSKPLHEQLTGVPGEEELTEEEEEKLLQPEEVEELKRVYGHVLELEEEEEEEEVEMCPCDDDMMAEEDDKKRKASGSNKALRRERKRQEREKRREEKRQKRKQKSLPPPDHDTEADYDDEIDNTDPNNPTRDCNSRHMKCFTHDNDHWETPPLWNTTLGEKLLGERSSGAGAKKDPLCALDGVECHRMDNEHWKVPPHWTLGPFCFCPNSNNNTYWCLRTLNETSNFLYCEFITGFISYYDMTKDPYQLRNAVHDLSYSVLQQLSDKLETLKTCKGRSCNMRTRLDDNRPAITQRYFT